MALLLCLCLFSVEMVHFSCIFENLREGIVRLHITANSDSGYDQSVKIAVRDALLKEGSYNRDILLGRANRELLRLGADYGARVSFKTRFVPEKEYKNLRLPEGDYRCIDVILGKGEGENWWCVAYPPLCFTESVTGELSGEARNILRSKLSDEAFYTVIKDGKIKYKFKILEVYRKITGSLGE